jgi:hypothetical protein
MSTTLSRLVFVRFQCRTYSLMGMRSGSLVLLCRIDGGLRTYSISSRGSGLQSMTTVGSLNLTRPILPPSSPSTGPLEAVPALRPHAQGNAGARHEDFPVLQNRNIQSVQVPRKTVFQKRPTTEKCRIRGQFSRV